MMYKQKDIVTLFYILIKFFKKKRKKLIRIVVNYFANIAFKLN